MNENVPKESKRIKYNSDALDAIDYLSLIGAWAVSFVCPPVGISAGVLQLSDMGARKFFTTNEDCTGGYRGTTMSRTIYRMGRILKR